MSPANKRCGLSLALLRPGFQLGCSSLDVIKEQIRVHYGVPHDAACAGTNGSRAKIGAKITTMYNSAFYIQDLTLDSYESSISGKDPTEPDALPFRVAVAEFGGGIFGLDLLSNK